jgi:YD repeat-containing protein
MVELRKQKTSQLLAKKSMKSHYMMSLAESLVTQQMDDGSLDGDDLVTKVTLYPGRGDSLRITENIYDWRNRLLVTEDGQGRAVTALSYDNQDQVIETWVLAGPLWNISYDVETDTLSGLAESNIEKKTFNYFDKRGRIYAKSEIDPDTNFAQSTGWEYDARNRVITQFLPGGSVTRTEFDLFDRPTLVSINGNSGGSETTVVETSRKYDDADNVTFTKVTEFNPLGQNRVTATSNYYDSENRIQTVVNHGTGGESLDSRPSAKPARGPLVLRTDFSYSSDGLTTYTQSPDGLSSYQILDGLGRVHEVVNGHGASVNILDREAAVNEAGSNSNAPARTTFSYDGLGRTVIKNSINRGAVGSTVEDRITYQYFNDGFGSYRLTYNPSVHAETNLFREKIFNNLGELVEDKTNTGLNHTYRYDVFGRIKTDTTESTGDQTLLVGDQTVFVDTGAVRHYEYDVFGNEISISEHNADGTNRSVVIYDRDGFGNITSNRSIVAGASIMVAAYPHENVNGLVRPAGITYFDGTIVDYEYANGIDSSLGRISSIEINGRQLESYEYLGAETPIQIEKHLVGSGSVNEAISYDRFGRMFSQNWGGIDLNFQYFYDQAGRLISVDDLSGVDFDQTFDFDAVGNLQAARINGTSVENYRTDSSGITRNVLVGEQRLREQDSIRPTFQGLIDENLNGVNGLNWLDNYLEEWHWGLKSPGDGAPPHALSVQFDPWGRVASRKVWDISYSLLDNYQPTLNQKQTFLYDASSNLVELVFRDVDPHTHKKSTFVNDVNGKTLTEYQYDNGQLAEFQRYVWSPVTGNLSYRELYGYPNGSSQLESRDFVAIDIEGNSIGLISADSGELTSRWRYIPSGKHFIVGGVGSASSPEELSFYRLHQQGLYIGAEGEGQLEITVLSGGQQYDAIQNSVVSVNAQAYKDDLDGVFFEGISWWTEYGTRITATAQVAFGTSEIVFGSAIAATGIGGAPGVLIAANGIDDAIQGVRILSGDTSAQTAKYSSTHYYAKAAGVSDSAASSIALGADIGLSLVAAGAGFSKTIGKGFVKAPRNGAQVASGKFDYLFGKATGAKNAAHNAPRTAQNAGQMRRLGIWDDATGRGRLQSHFDDVVNDPTNITRSYSNKFGKFETRESLFAGPSGQFAKFESTWEVLADGTRRLTTVIPFGGR